MAIQLFENYSLYHHVSIISVLLTNRFTLTDLYADILPTQPPSYILADGSNDDVLWWSLAWAKVFGRGLVSHAESTSRRRLLRSLETQTIWTRLFFASCMYRKIGMTLFVAQSIAPLIYHQHHLAVRRRSMVELSQDLQECCDKRAVSDGSNDATSVSTQLFWPFRFLD